MRVLLALGAVGGVSALVGAAYALLRYLSDKWISAKFQERLEAFKHAQQREVEGLRFQINGLLDRAVKLHTQEFEALPALWSRLNQSFWYVSDFVGAIQRHADLDRMSKAQFDEFLEKSDLDVWQKDEVRSAAEKNDVYRGHKFWRDYSKVNKKFVRFNRYLDMKSIFLQNDVKKACEELQGLMHGALVERKYEEQHPNPRVGRWAKREALEERGKACRAEIETMIKARLWNAVRIDTDPQPPRDDRKPAEQGASG